MIVAHLGSFIAPQGGPAGYLLQLQRAFAAHGSGGCDVQLPPMRSTPRQAAAERPWTRVTRHIRRVRRHLGLGPTQYRPAIDSLRAPGGEAHAMLATAWRELHGGVTASLRGAISARADVLFAHDAPAAEAALEARAAGQEVWLFLHTPMPLALYLTWSWGVPEMDWQEIATWPDVRDWSIRERDVIAHVDRVLLPCPEAADEFARCEPTFAAPLASATMLLTGAGGPPETAPTEERAALRRRFGLPLEAPVALYLGNAQPYRGLDVLLEAIDRLPPAREVPGVVAVAGPPTETLPISRRLVALGPVSAVRDLLAAVDIVVNVNRFSLFDLSTIEALEAGRPLLLHATGGNKTFARLGAGVEMVDTLTPSAVAEGLTRMFAMDPGARNSLGDRSRACYDAHTTLRHLRDRHVDLYARAVGTLHA